MMATLLTILLGAVGSLLAAELLGWCAWFAERIVDRAITRLPGSYRARYRQEWYADMDMLRRRGGLSVLAWAVVLYLNVERVAGGLQSSPEIPAKRHRHPTIPEATRVSRLLLLSSPKSTTTVKDRLRSVLLQLFMLPVLTGAVWTIARFDRHFCDAVREITETNMSIE